VLPRSAASKAAATAGHLHATATADLSSHPLPPPPVASATPPPKGTAAVRRRSTFLWNRRASA